MRGVLVLTGLLISLVVAFLVAWPQLVEVPALREQLAGLMREVAGPETRLEGAVRLELLPHPRVTIERAVVGDRIEVGPGPRFGADRIDIDLALVPLLAGRIEPRGIQLVRPVLGITDPDEAAVTRWLRPLLEGPLRRVDRIVVVDGSVELAIAPPSLLTAIDLTATRDGGRFEVAATLAVAGEPVRLEVEGGPLSLDEPVPLTAAAELGPLSQPVVVDFVGHVRPSASLAAGRLSIDAQRGRLPAWFGPGPWPAGVLKARISADADSAQLSDLLLDLPEGELRGVSNVTYAGLPRIELSLTGTSFTLSRELADACRRMMASVRRGALGQGSIRLDLASLAWAGGQIRRVRADAAWSQSGLHVRELDAVLPGQSVLRWRGQRPAEPDAPTTGAMSLQSGELRGLLGWMGVDPASLPRGGLTSLDLNARASIAGGSLALTDLTARVDASSLKGSVAVSPEPRPRVDLDLQLNRLNTALYAPWPGTWVDWRSRLEALDGSIVLTIAEVGHDILRGSEFALRAALDAGRIELSRLRLAEFAGTALDLSGSLDVGLGAWDLIGSLSVAEPRPMLRLLGWSAPIGVDRLAPLQLSASTRNEAGVASVDLQLAGTDVAASLRGALEGETADGELGLTVAVDAARSGDLLEALGWPAPPDQPEFGPFAASLELTRASGPIDAKLRVSAGGSKADGQLSIDLPPTRPRVAGRLSMGALDMEFAAAVYQTIALPLGFPAGDPWLWPGIWPRQPLDWDWLNALDLKLGLAVERLLRGGTGVGDARVEIELADGDLGLRNVRLPMAGGVVSGNLTVGGRGEHAVVGADLRLDGARIEQLARTAAAGSAIRGRLDLRASLVGEGRGVADLVASIGGNGSFALTDAAMPDLTMPAPPLAGEVDTGIEEATLAGSFDLRRGVLDAPALQLSSARGGADLDLELDLLTWMLSATVAQHGNERRFLGPPGRISPLPAP